MQKCHLAAGIHHVSVFQHRRGAKERRTALCMMPFLILLLHSLAKPLIFLDCPAASKISAKCVNSTLSIAFAGVRKAVIEGKRLMHKESDNRFGERIMLAKHAYVVRRSVVGSDHACARQVRQEW